MSSWAVSGMEVGHSAGQVRWAKKHAYIHTENSGEIISKERPERWKGKGTQRKSNIMKIKAGDTEDEVVTVVE